jgi:hypothetical protein
MIEVDHDAALLRDVERARALLARVPERDGESRGKPVATERRDRGLRRRRRLDGLDAGPRPARDPLVDARLARPRLDRRRHLGGHGLRDRPRGCRRDHADALAAVDPTEQGRELTSEALELLQLLGAAPLAGAPHELAPHALERRAHPGQQLRDDRIPRIERQVA